MSKRARALILGATLAAITLVGLTAGAHAQANDPDGKDARRLATERQVDEAWRHPQVAAEQPTVADDSRRPPTEAQVGRPGAIRPAPRCRRPSRAGNPAGSSPRWG